ncbi:MAG TPA: hypothetical protein VIM73_17690 [Polyangiaceae bacterium]
MRTFLITARMSPELAARVAASVRGKPTEQRASTRRRYVSLGRLGALGMVIAILLASWEARQRRVQRLEETRAALLGELRSRFGALTAAQKKLPGRIVATVQRHAGPGYPGDWLEGELRDSAGLVAALNASTVYLRASTSALASAADVNELAKVARDSSKDAFVACLQSPPATRTEKALRKSVREAYAGAIPTPHVHRLFPLLSVAPLWAPEWERSVRDASSQSRVDELTRSFRGAAIDGALRAADAEQLLLVVDEPGDPTVPAELDGERPHHVRVVLARLNDDSVRLRRRVAVDPSWLSATTRAEYAHAIDSCSLALEVLSAASG